MLHTPIGRVAASLSCICLTTAAASAASLFVAGPTGDVWKADTESGAFTYFGCTCNGPIQSLTIGKNAVFAGDTFGSIVSFNLDTGFLQGFNFVPAGATAMVANHDELLVSEMAGVVRRVSQINGDVGGEMNAPIQVDAMVEHDGFLYVGGPSGDVWRTPVGGGEFTYFGCACIPNIRGLTVGDGSLYAAGQGGLVLEFDLENGFLVGGFVAPVEPSAIVFLDGDVLVSDASGLIVRMDAATGEMEGQFQAPHPVEAMALLSDDLGEFGDLDGDGAIGGSDLALLLGSWGVCGGCAADLTGDGLVNAADLAAMLGAWGA